jgi:hypothetical protein
MHVGPGKREEIEVPNDSDRDALDTPPAGNVTSQSEAAMQDASVVQGGQSQSESSLGPYPSYHGRAISWIAVGLMTLGFIVGGLGLMLGHGGPTWWAVWAGSGVAVLGLLVAIGSNMFEDWY